MDSPSRTARGAFGTAITWAAGWFLVALPILVVAQLVLGLDLTNPWIWAILTSTRIGFTGFLTGGAFSAFLRLAFRDRDVLSLKAGPLSIGGALAAAVASLPVALLSPIMWGWSVTTAGFVAGAAAAAVLGGATAFSTIRIAQRAARELAAPTTAALESEQEDAMKLLGDASR